MTIPRAPRFLVDSTDADTEIPDNDVGGVGAAEDNNNVIDTDSGSTDNKNGARGAGGTDNSVGDAQDNDETKGSVGGPAPKRWCLLPVSATSAPKTRAQTASEAPTLQSCDSSTRCGTHLVTTQGRSLQSVTLSISWVLLTNLDWTATW
jgi:hypothetical protein